MSELKISHSLVVVEDDPDDQFFLKKAFEEIGFAQYVEWLDSAEQLFTYLKNLADPSDLPYSILLDYNMPVMNGEEVLIELKKEPNYKSIPVLIYSTGISDPVIERLMSLGADGCYIKSYYTTDIIEFAKFLQQKIASAVFR